MTKYYYKSLFILLFLSIVTDTTSATNVTSVKSGTQKATFAGGCFWCMEEAFEAVDGVIRVTSGFTGGDLKNPSYKDVSTGTTGHFEAIEVIFNPEIVRYDGLLKTFWANIDPTNEFGQFCDEGNQYRAGVFYHNLEQKILFEESLQDLKTNRGFKPQIYVVVEPVKTFYVAEDKLQDYYKKHPMIYKFYKATCGRSKRLKKIWSNKFRSN